MRVIQNNMMLEIFFYVELTCTSGWKNDFEPYRNILFTRPTAWWLVYPIDLTNDHVETAMRHSPI